ncbi:uncharacterized protein LOC111350052 [Spodoptera litura]|uniref:Uncharacterized protein LOC111350052 n=1 Tax=Spodoptera litura TaxID=69820 RepID=A0A9J7IJ91_SPOLT|nr:uncharacterized protein LOC111350052 [Spodoptera litura]
MFRFLSNSGSKANKNTDRKKSNEDDYFSLALKCIAKRFTVCLKSVCCFPLEKMVPISKRRKLIVAQSSQISGLKDPEAKIQVIPQSTMTINESTRSRSDFTTRKSSKKFRCKKLRCKMFESIKKMNGASGSTMMKSSIRCNANTSKKKMSKPSIRSEKKWRKIIRKTNPSQLKWIKNETKARQNLTGSCTDNEESAGDGPVSPNISRYFKKCPLRWMAVKQKNYSDTIVNCTNDDSVEA